MAETQVPTDLRRLDIFPLDLGSITLMHCSKVCIYLVSPTGLRAGVPYVDGVVSAIFDGRHSTGSSTLTGCEGLGPRPLFLCSLHELPFEHDDRQNHGPWERFVADGTIALRAPQNQNPSFLAQPSGAQSGRLRRQMAHTKLQRCLLLPSYLPISRPVRPSTQQ